MNIVDEGRFFIVFEDGSTILKETEYKEFLKQLDEFCLNDLKHGVNATMMMPSNGTRFDCYQDKNLLILQEFNRRKDTQNGKS